MCASIPIAFLLLTAFAGLTALRFLRPTAPHAELLITLFAMLDHHDSS